MQALAIAKRSVSPVEDLSPFGKRQIAYDEVEVMSVISRALFLSVVAVSTVLQSANVAQEKPQTLMFDVATVRPTKPGQQSGGIKAIPSGMGYTAQNVPVKLMISLMYKVPMRQIEGGPEWMSSEPFDVEARVDHSYSIDDLHTMYQNLLADRFALRFHKDVRQGPIYALTVDPSGLKMKPNASPQDYNIPVSGGPAHTVGVRVPMPYLCWLLGQILQNDHRPVVDQTGLTGNYDFTLAYMPELPPNVSADTLPPEFKDLPSVFTAVKEQLGLRLQPQKGPVDYYVIDHIEKPTDN